MPIEAIQGKVRSEPLNRNFSYVDSRVKEIDLEVVNVRNFGATGDGETDDSDAFFYAIMAAKNRNGIMYVPRGVYAISVEADASDLIVDGAGAKFVAKGDNHGLRLAGDNIFIRNLSIEEPTELSAGCLAVYGDNNTISNVTVYNKNKTSRGDIAYSQRHIDVQGDNNRIIGCDVRNGRIGIYFNGIGNRVLNCNVEGNIVGVRVAPDTHDFEIAHNRIIGGDILPGEQGADGIHVTSTGSATAGNIHRNYIEAADEHGIYSHGSDVLITENVITKCWSSGIKVATGKDIVIQNNLAYDNTRDPGSTAADIYVQSPVSHVVVDGNTCHSSENGIRVVLRDETHQLSNVAIKNNVCRNHLSDSYNVQGKSDISVVSNIGQTLNLSADTSQQKMIISGNKVDDLIINRMSSTLFSGNVIRQSLYVTTNNTNLEFRDNDIGANQDIDLRRVRVFDGNSVKLSDGAKIYPSSGSMLLRSFCGNYIDATALDAHYALHFRSNSDLLFTKFCGNHFDMVSARRAVSVVNANRTVFAHNTTNSTDTRAFNFEDVRNSAISGNVAASGGGIYLDVDSSSNVLVGNVADITDDGSGNTGAGGS